MYPIYNRVGWLSAAFTAVLVCGCQTSSSKFPFPPTDAPRELEMVSLPVYRVAPPDILLIEAVKAIPKPPVKVEPLDVLFVQLTPSLPDEPLSGLVTVEPDGTIMLGASYGGSVPVSGMTVIEIKAAIEKHIKTVVKIKDPMVTVTLSQSRAAQRISGQHLIRPDGTISLGMYGEIRVSGMTLAEVRMSVEAQLSEFLVDPQVTVDVGGFNSKIYYVIYDGGGVGQTVIRMPVTGGETVLDAIAQLNGLPAVSNQDQIWVSRPLPSGLPSQVLPVNWRAVSELGETSTNYQLMPGDRVYVAAYPLVTLDNQLARIFAPIERILGITLLGASTVNTIRFPPNQNSNNNNNNNN